MCLYIYTYIYVYICVYIYMREGRAHEPMMGSLGWKSTSLTHALCPARQKSTVLIS